jgi:hypothetical protein
MGRQSVVSSIFHFPFVIFQFPFIELRARVFEPLESDVQRATFTSSLEMKNEK